jgi:hypothetical protein
VQLATIQELARYGTTEYDWRACEARLNGGPGTPGADRHPYELARDGARWPSRPKPEEDVRRPRRSPRSGGAASVVHGQAEHARQDASNLALTPA